MFEAPGTLWLFAQELRVLWRGSILVRTHKFVVVPVVGTLLLFQGIALLLARGIVQHPLPAAEMLLTANINLVFLFALMFSRAVTSSIDVIYGRGDADFLLASPIPPGRVLAVRMVGVGLSIAAPWMLLGGVLANALVVFGQVWALAVYPMLLAEALFTAAVAFGIVVVLLGHVGPGTARRLGHSLALFTGVGIFVLGQAPRFMPPAQIVAFWQFLLPGQGSGGLGFLFARGLLGQPGALAASLAFAAVTFSLVWIVLAKPFADGAITAAAYRPRGNTVRQGGQFRSSPFGALFAKDLRLLCRFPGILTQTVYRSLTLVPVLLILAGRFHVTGGYAVAAPLLVFLAGQLGLFFISVLCGTEDAAELAATAPVDERLPDYAGLATAGYFTLLLLALPVAATLIRAPGLAFPVLFGIVGVLLCNLTLGQSLPIPLVRADFGKSQRGTLLGLILGVFMSSVWSFFIWLIAAPAPLVWLLHQGNS